VWRVKVDRMKFRIEMNCGLKQDDDDDDIVKTMMWCRCTSAVQEVKKTPVYTFDTSIAVRTRFCIAFPSPTLGNCKPCCDGEQRNEKRIGNAIIILICDENLSGYLLIYHARVEGIAFGHSL
jgi:hypothetical protein